MSFSNLLFFHPNTSIFFVKSQLWGMTRGPFSEEIASIGYLWVFIYRKLSRLE
ncbi:hypothetical protein OUZ56_021789 [Daphnia magna]|uniref:Uncharacterized protein n=1 Tax=Daphnia magna TaxID=35525 RepID=A0ABR0AUK2_9CRUS|nr:hypothetical protein OUZ56_021789 [Daphnia magna]